MAIAFSAQSRFPYAGSQNGSVAHTPVGTPRLIVVVSHEAASGSVSNISGVTYGGVAMTKVATIANAGVIVTIIWELLANIPTGTQTVAWTSAASSSKEFHVASFTAAGAVVRDANPAPATGSSTTPSISISPTAAGAIVDGHSHNYRTAGTGAAAGQNTIYYTDVGSQQVGSSYKIVIGAGATTMSWAESSSAAWAEGAVSWKEGTTQKLIAVNTASETDAGQVVRNDPKKRLAAFSGEIDGPQAISRRKVKAVGQVAETDATQATAHQKIHAVVQSAEIDTGQTVARLKSKASVSTSEIDVPQVVAKRKIHVVSTAAESDSTSAVTHPAGGIQTAQETDLAKAIHIGLNRLAGVTSDTEVAQPTTHQKVRAVGQASESNTAFVEKSVKIKAVGQSTESNVTQGTTRRKTKSIAFLTETDAAQTTAIRKARAVAQSTETESAQAVAKRKIKTVGTTGETDASQIVSLKGKIIVAVGTASEVDASQAVRWAPKRRIASSATETDTAQALTKVHFKAIGRASEVETAPAVNRQKVKQISTIAETNTSQAVRIQKSYQIGTAAEANSAPAVTRRVAGTYDVHTASEVDVAFSVAARRVFPIVLTHLGEPTLVTNGTPLHSRLSEPNRRTNGEPILTSELEPILN